MRRFFRSILLMLIGLLLMLYGFFNFNSNFNDTVYTYTIKETSDFKKININNFFGLVNIIPADKNEIVFSYKVKVNKDGDIIEIKSNEKNKTMRYDELTIYYNKKIDVNIKDAFIKAKIILDKESNLNIEDIFGKVNIKANGNYKTLNDDFIGIYTKSLNKFDDNKEYGLITIKDAFGKISIYK